MSSFARVVDPETSAEDARYEAQKLAFAPMMFQAARAIRDLGVLQVLYRARVAGRTAAECAEAASVSPYAASLLLEAGYATGLCAYDGERFMITKMGVIWLQDELTNINAEFNHHVCYKGAFHFEEVLRTGLPKGLAELGPWDTLYEGMSTLPADAKRAWFAFDHYYSDGVFEHCLPVVLPAGPGAPQTLADIGANTGRFTRLCLEHNAGVHVTMVDLPQQLGLAGEAFHQQGPRGQQLATRVTAFPIDMKQHALKLPQGLDVYWMSQFLDCFSEAEIVSILKRVRAAMKPASKVYILETFWDLQIYPAARHCVIGTSLYFACMANGNSRMYDSKIMTRLVGEAGLRVATMSDLIGPCHTLLTCVAA
jgi:O-methyltransferase domain